MNDYAIIYDKGALYVECIKECHKTGKVRVGDDYGLFGNIIFIGTKHECECVETELYNDQRRKNNPPSNLSR